jgi:hypothetical protein
VQQHRQTLVVYIPIEVEFSSCCNPQIRKFAGDRYHLTMAIALKHLSLMLGFDSVSSFCYFCQQYVGSAGAGSSAIKYKYAKVRATATGVETLLTAQSCQMLSARALGPNFF